MNNLLIDTNILIYLKDVSSIYHQVSLNLFRGSDRLFTTSKNLSEYYAVVTRGEYPLLSPYKALQDLKEFMSRCEFLYPTTVSYQKLTELVLLHHPKGLKIHDFEIASIALVNGISKIATLIKNDFQRIIEMQVISLS